MELGIGGFYSWNKIDKDFDKGRWIDEERLIDRF